MLALAVAALLGAGCSSCPTNRAAAVDVTVTNATAGTTVSYTVDGSPSMPSSFQLIVDGGTVWAILGPTGHYVVMAAAGTRTASATVDVALLDSCGQPVTQNVALTLPP